MAIKGLRNFRYVQLKEDNEKVIDYMEEIKKLTGARNVKIKPKVDSAELYGDDQLLETASALGAIEVEIDVADLTLTERADFLGYKFENGVLIEDKNFNPKPIAFGFEAPKSNGGVRMIWLTKGTCEPIEEEAKTKEDKVDFQTQKVKLKFMPRIHDGVHKFTSDTDIENSPTSEEFFSIDFLKTGKRTNKSESKIQA